MKVLVTRYAHWVSIGILFGLIGFAWYLKVAGSMTDLYSRLLVFAIGFAAVGTIAAFKLRVKEE